MTKIEQKIPDGWEVKTLGDIFTFKNGLNKEKEFFGKGIPIINYTDVYNNRGLTEKSIKGKVDLNAKEISLYAVQKGDVFFTRTSETINEIGYTSVLLENIENCVFSGFVLRGRENNDSLDLNFKKYCFSTFQFRKEIISKSSMTTRALTNGTLLSDMNIIIPKSKSEQKKIAEILGAWDNGIETLDKLIKAKEKQKKSLMQKLLTGKHRLKGFTQPWEETKLGDVLISKSIRNKNLKLTKVLSVTNSKGFILPEEQFARSVASEDLSNYKIVQRGEFAYNPSRLNVGSIDRLDNFENGLLSPMYVIFSCSKQLLSEYMKQWILTYEFNLKVKNSAQGSVRETVDFKTLSSIKIVIPTDLEEQKAIADVLSTADEEICLLNAKLSAIKEQKKGLMQQFLTGKIRVKVN